MKGLSWLRASSMVALKARGIDQWHRRHRAVASPWRSFRRHSLPLLDAQFLPNATGRSDRGTARPRAARRRARSVLSGSTATAAFFLKVMEIELGQPTDVLGHSVTTAEVRHYPGRLDRLLRGRSLCLFRRHRMGRALVSVAAGADLFIAECYGYSGQVTGHLTWEVIRRDCPIWRRIMLTQERPCSPASTKFGRRRACRRGRSRPIFEEGASPRPRHRSPLRLRQSASEV
jgi:hypothetical protein